MKKQINQVREFRQRFNLPIAGCKSSQDCLLHERLIQEELDEMKNAIDIFEISDAIIDQMYLLFGYAIDLGIDDKLEAMFDEVHSSNMSKLDRFNKPIYREDGKVMKGENYFKPNLKKIIEESEKEIKITSPELTEEEIIELSKKFCKEEYERVKNEKYKYTNNFFK